MSATDRSELDGYEALVSELRATPPVAPERLRERVLELGPSARRRMSKRRRLTLVVVPVAAVLAVGAALVHGFVSSGSNQHRGLPTFHGGRRARVADLDHAPRRSRVRTLAPARARIKRRRCRRRLPRPGTPSIPQRANRALCLI